MREDLGVRERGFFAPGGPVRAVLKGDTLILTAQTQFVLDIIKNPRVQQLAAQKASAFFGRPMQAQFALAGQTDASGKDPMDALIARGKRTQRYYDDQIKENLTWQKADTAAACPWAA